VNGGGTILKEVDQWVPNDLGLLRSLKPIPQTAAQDDGQFHIYLISTQILSAARAMARASEGSPYHSAPTSPSLNK
jgi:hypothetical protein